MNGHSWKLLRSEQATALTDARLQLHHGAQLVSAFGVSFLPSADDDSHTNLEWVRDRSALASRSFRDVRVALRVEDFVFEVANESFAARGKRASEVSEWIRGTLSSAGLDADRYTLDRHYEIPSHPVADGAAFNPREEHLGELSRWFDNGALVLGRLRATDPRASEVRVWPHHFDLGTLITLGRGRAVGVGLEPGDRYYDEPYFYVNMSPQPAPDAVADISLGGEGVWHTHEWIGAVLPGSRLSFGGGRQELQISQFIESAVQGATTLLD